MWSVEAHFLAVLFITLLLAFSLPSATGPIQAASPFADFYTIFGATPPGGGPPSRVTVNNPTNSSNIQQAQSIGLGSSCLAEVGGGALLGAAIGVWGLGIGAPIGAGVGALAGLITCGVQSQYPSFNQGVGTAVINNIPGAKTLGDFGTAVFLIAQFALALIFFVPHFIIYISAIAQIDSTSAGMLALWLTYSISIISLFVIKTIRGNSIV